MPRRSGVAGPSGEAFWEGEPRGLVLAMSRDMSVKTMLPILGVGSAVAILGMAAVRRQARRAAQSGVARERRESGVHSRIVLDDVDDVDDAALAAATPELTSDFWDASPESYAADSQGRLPIELENYDALDPEDLSAEWLRRATEAPAGADGGFGVDDPAEIPADSMSMVSEASRHAAALDFEELDEASDRVADSRV